MFFNVFCLQIDVFNIYDWTWFFRFSSRPRIELKIRWYGSIHGFDTFFRRTCCIGVSLWWYVVGRSTDVDSKNITLRIAAGITTGAIALSIAQPTDLVKVRMQSTKGRYEGCLHAYRTIVRDEGVRGLWKGSSACTLQFFNLRQVSILS